MRRFQSKAETESTSREIEFSTTTPSPSILRVTTGSEPASSERGIVIVHQITLLAPAANVDGVEGQFASQSPLGTMIEVVGRQVEVLHSRPPMPNQSQLQPDERLFPREFGHGSIC